MSDAFLDWMASLEGRHLADLTFSEVSRSLRALSSNYVERRRKIAEGGALSGAGKRAAFALFYGPLHYLLIRHILESLPGAAAALPKVLVDLGCGTGVAGVAWAGACQATPAIVGIDRHPWALGEAAKTYRDFGLAGRTRMGDIAVAALPRDRAAFVAAFAMNELTKDAREALLSRLVARAGGGDRLLVVEPLAGFVAPWWNHWRERFEEAGGRADQWRFRADLPPIVEKLDRAAGLDHRELTGRSLWLSGAS